MAGDWIKVEVTTPDKPEVHQMAEELGIDPDAVLGKLIRIWAWFDQHSENANAVSVTETLLNRIAGVEGFTLAMANAGWIIPNNGRFSLPKFDRHNGETAKSRALTAKRVAAHKRRTNAAANAPLTLVALPREEKRREDIKEKPLAPDATRPALDKIEFDFSKGQFLGITEDQELAWQEAFPAVPIPPAIAQAAAWLSANPANRKSNYKRFLVNWFSRAQERAPRVRA